MANKDFNIIKLRGKRIRKEKRISDFIGGFASILCALSIATVGLEITAQSLHSEIRGHAREIVRV